MQNVHLHIRWKGESTSRLAFIRLQGVSLSLPEDVYGNGSISFELPERAITNALKGEMSIGLVFPGETREELVAELHGPKLHRVIHTAAEAKDCWVARGHVLAHSSWWPSPSSSLCR